MSILEAATIDAIAASDDGTELVLLMLDEISWDDANTEYEHLLALQDKINAYVSYIESGQYSGQFSGNYQNFVFEIHFAFAITENCLKFLNEVAKQLKEELNIQISVQTDNEEN